MFIKDKLMKNKKLLVGVGIGILACVVALVIIILVSCNGGKSYKDRDKGTDASVVTENDSSNQVDRDNLRISDGAILHCWNWSYNNIKLHMEEIAQAGYTAIQTSPIQQPKDYTYEGKVYNSVGTPNGTGGSDGQWWKLYQPVTFNICDNGQTWLGTKQEFADMCAEAEKYGVSVIVDVVANHMGNITGWKNSMSDITPQVGTYWKQDMLTDKTYWHINDYQCWMSDGRMHLVLGTIGMPDLDTSNKLVQQMVLDFLKECVDCGADGFRFDAAKHIETPDDSSDIASDFWPTVIGGIREYADHELFVYGEILNTPGDNFSISNYTKYMSVTDSATGDNRRNDVRYDNASSAANGGYSYDASKVVVWNESHDTYVGAGSSYLADDIMIKQTWAIVASRKEAVPLYFARPYYSSQILKENGDKKSTHNLVQTNMGDVGTIASEDGIAVVYNTDSVPYASVSMQGGTMTSEAEEITITLENASKGTYKIDGGKVKEFTGSVKVKVGEGIEYGQSTCLEITAADGGKTYTYKHIYNKNRHEDDSIKFDENSGKYVIYMKNTAGWEDVYCYMWVDNSKNNKGWPGIKMTKLSDDIYIYATDEEYPNIIFNDGSGTQTGDMKWPGNGYIYDNKTGEWKEK